MEKSAALAAMALVCGTVASANERCLGTLISSTFQLSSESSSDWRLSQFLSEEAYNERKRGASTEAIVYGIPMGGSYEDYKKASNRRMQASDESLSRSQAENMLWTGLSDQALEAYKVCLTRDQFGLFLYPRNATKTQVMLVLEYRPTDGTGGSVSLNWIGHRPVGAPTHAQPNSTTNIIVDRPKAGEDYLIAVNTGILAAEATITSYPQPPEPFKVPGWTDIAVELRGNSATLMDGFELRNMSYRWIGPSKDDHAFKFDVYGQGGRIKEGVEWVGKNGDGQAFQNRTMLVEGYVFDFGFYRWDDFNAILRYRLY